VNDCCYSDPRARHTLEALYHQLAGCAVEATGGLVLQHTSTARVGHSLRALTIAPSWMICSTIWIKHAPCAVEATGGLVLQETSTDWRTGNSTQGQPKPASACICHCLTDRTLRAPPS
jgi:hypothetical protein